MIYTLFSRIEEKKIKNKKRVKGENMSKNKNKKEESERKWEVAPIIDFFAENPDLLTTIIGKSTRGGTFKVKRSSGQL